MVYAIVIICTLVFSVTLNILYFLKKHIETKETKVYAIALVSNLMGLIIELLCKFLIYNFGVGYIWSYISVKIYLLYLLFFVLIMTIYVYNTNCKYNSKFKIFISIFYGILGLISLFLPMDIEVAYATGTAVNFVYIIFAITMLFWFLIIIKTYKKENVKKNIPLVILIIFAIIASIIQNMNADVTLITSLEFLILFIMYHTIENPDIKTIEQLNVAKDQAEKANRAKTDFLSSMSHEIRTPLNAIMGFSNGLLDDDLPTESKEDVNNIIMASNSLLELVNGILDISKIEANKLEIINVGYNFHKMFDEVVLLTKARLGDKPLEFNYNYDESIPEYLYGDATRIKQVIINLLTNSVKYTKEGSITFNINSVIKNNIVRLIITVEDSGIGIKKESIDKLFTKFERLGVERNTTTEGTGLGLAITKRLVELMGGKIVVQSIYGKGSKFGVAIDQRIVEGAELEKLKNEKQEVKEVDIKNLNNKKVLIVDDNILNIKVAQRLLKPYNLDIDTSLSGLECLDKVRSGNQYDLILLDDMMPKMSGVETLNKLKGINGYSIPTVALTANAITGMREKYLNDGFDDYLGKPIERNELDRVLKKYLNK